MNLEVASSKDSESRDKRIIRSAANLLLRCEGYVADYHAELNGWKLYYAVDADIIKLYLAPVVKSKYASVFPVDESNDTRELLARLIGDFILRDLKRPATAEQSDQLFMVPPHDQELERIIFALARSVIDTVEDIERSEVLSELWQRLQLGDAGAVAQWLIDAAPRLVEFFYGKDSPQAELSRFKALGNSRLLNIERYRENSSGWTFPLPWVGTEEEGFTEFAALFSSWKERLFQRRIHSQPPMNVIRDAHALAVVEFVNGRMCTQQRKLLLITGTVGIHEAAASYVLSPAGQPAESFAELYIRHPQAFMADPNFFDGKPDALKRADSEFKLVDWLDLFFPHDVEESEDRRRPFADRLQLRSLVDVEDHESLGRVLKSAQRKAPFAETILDEWRTQVHATSVARNVDTSESRGVALALELVRWVRERIDKGFTLDRLRSDLSMRAMQSVSSLYSSTSWLGLWSLARVRHAAVRGIPALRFEGAFTLAREYCARVVDTMRTTNPDTAGETEAAEIDLAEMYSELAKTDETHYLAHVVHALAYATKGNWHATKTLCRIALRTVDAVPDEQKRNLRGREAAYLLAVAQRRLASELKDLQLAREYLAEAESRENTTAVMKDNRFISEAIAIDVATTNFHFFIEKDDSLVGNELERLVPAGAELLQKVTLDNLKPAREWVTQQVITNVLDLALVARVANVPIHPNILRHIVSLVSLANEELSKERVAARNRDSVAEFIYLVASAVFSSDLDSQHMSITKLKHMHFPTYMRFDAAREKAFRALADRDAGLDVPGQKSES